MNKRHDPGRRQIPTTQTHVAVELPSPQSPEWLADQRIRAELRALPPGNFPALARARVLRVVKLRRRAPWLAGLAAALAMGLAVALWFQTPEPGAGPEVTSGHAQELQRALELIGEVGRQSIRIASRSVADQVGAPLSELERLRGRFGPWFAVELTHSPDGVDP